MLSEVAVIQDDLQRIRDCCSLAPGFTTSQHDYKTNPPLLESSAREFELRHKIVLPDEYRTFLTEVGNGGAGPGYGVFRLGEMDDGWEYKSWHENDGFVGSLSAPFLHSQAWNDLSEEPQLPGLIEPNAEQELRYLEELEKWEQCIYWNPVFVNGAIPICHHGCALRQWLVITGPEAGHVWRDDRADRDGLSPVELPNLKRVTFLQWYRHWLDEMLDGLRLNR